MDENETLATVDRRAVFGRMDEAHVEIGRRERDRLTAILECDRHNLWRGQGCRDLAEFLAGRYGISKWKANRWIGAAYALEHLPQVSHALTNGVLNLDKVVELTRFATPATEGKLIRWAVGVNPGAIRRRADAEIRKSLERVQAAEAERHLTWWWHADGKGLEFEGRLPVAEGRVFISAIDRLAKDLPKPVPQEQAAVDDYTIDQRRADALARLASTTVAEDADPDRATVVVHAPHDVLAKGRGNGSVSDGPVIDASTVRRLACDGRLEVSLHDSNGKVVGIGRADREAPHWLRRQVLHRDSHRCTFPGCEMKRFLQLHHMHEWELGGPTDLDNLISVCTVHHKLVHEFGWSVTLSAEDMPIWFRPSGRRFELGPAPPTYPESEPIANRNLDSAPWPALWHLLHSDDHSLTEEAALREFLKMGAPKPSLGKHRALHRRRRGDRRDPLRRRGRERQVPRPRDRGGAQVEQHQGAGSTLIEAHSHSIVPGGFDVMS